MSTWGLWEYWGIISGLVAMIVCLFLICIAFLAPAPPGAATRETPLAGLPPQAGDQPEAAAAGNKHAA